MVRLTNPSGDKHSYCKTPLRRRMVVTVPLMTPPNVEALVMGIVF